MTILGIDPGFATVGFGIIKKEKQSINFIECGCIETLPTFDFIERLNLIAKDLQSLIQEYQPNYCAIEELYFNKNIKTGIKVAQARGVILNTLYDAQIPITEYNPLTIKSTITGDGKADKSQVQYMVQKILNLPGIPQPDDAADGLAIALTKAYTL